MSYTALYRKFRPANFEEVKGQEAIVRTLKNQVNAGRLGHAYLFCGTRGTGKTSVARVFAKAVNCEHPVDGSGCGQCSSCRAIAAGNSMNLIEIDAASNNKVEDVRRIIEEVAYSPAEGKYKIYIVDEVHMLSASAFNALLKTLEEPPSYVIFILATTEVHKLPITILSRCQRYDFKRISIDTVTDRLKELMETEGISVEEKALRYIARTADGSMRDALSMLDQCLAFHFGEMLTYDITLDLLGAVDTAVFGQLLEHVGNTNVVGCIELLEDVVIQGRDLTQFVNDFTWYLRNLLMVQCSEKAEDIIDMSAENMDRLKKEAAACSTDQVMRYIRVFSELSERLKYAERKRILIEVAIVKLCRPQMETDLESLIGRIRDLERRLEEGVYMTAPAAAAEQPTEVRKKEKPREMPQAVPEDIRQLVERWSSIQASMSGSMKAYLKHARLSIGSSGQLMIVVEDGPSSDYFLVQEGHKEELESILSGAIGKQVEVQIEAIRDRRDFEASYVDLSEVIHMEIEIED